MGLRASGSRGGLVSGRVAILVRSSIPLTGRGTVPGPGALALTSFGTRASHPAKACRPGHKSIWGDLLAQMKVINVNQGSILRPLHQEAPF